MEMTFTKTFPTLFCGFIARAANTSLGHDLTCVRTRGRLESHVRGIKRDYLTETKQPSPEKPHLG